MSRLGFARVVLVPMMALVASACGAEDQRLTVQVQSDLVPRVEFHRIRTALEGGVPEPLIIDTEVRDDDDFRGGADVAQFDGLVEDDYLLRVELVDDTGGVVVGRSLLVALGDSLTSTIVLSRDCRTVSCPGAGDPATNSACLSGRCVDPRCSEQTPGDCGAAVCTATSDCPAGPACAEPRCTLSGACLRFPGTSCEPTQTCDPDLGCQP